MISGNSAKCSALAILVLTDLSVPSNAEELQPGTPDTSMGYFDRVLILEEEITTSANASVGDLNGDGILDILLIKGRHWPVTNQILLGSDAGDFAKPAQLNEIADRSYTGALADLDRDGDLDIVVSNDKPDRNLIYLNDGEARFTVSSTFGDSQWGTRNVSVADIEGESLLLSLDRGEYIRVCVDDDHGPPHHAPELAEHAIDLRRRRCRDLR